MNIKVKVPMYKQREFFQICFEIIIVGRGTKGCLRYVIQKDLEIENLFQLVTEWESWEDVESYVRSQDFGTLMGAAKVLGNDLEVRMSTLMPTGGMETIKKIRQISA